MNCAHRNGKTSLTPKENAFISAYLGGASSAASAAANAGYKSPHKVAFRIIHKRHIAAEIERRSAIRRENEKFDINKTQQLLAYFATFDRTTAFKPGTKELLPMAKWPDQRLCRAVDSIKFRDGKDGTKLIKIGFT
jgi:phage terminase small subunit